MSVGGKVARSGQPIGDNTTQQHLASGSGVVIRLDDTFCLPMPPGCSAQPDREGDGKTESIQGWRSTQNGGSAREVERQGHGI
ncbi:MAG: hypothetical protein ACK52U_04660 [Synechococcaceae cyanobacterium]